MTHFHCNKCNHGRFVATTSVIVVLLTMIVCAASTVVTDDALAVVGNRIKTSSTNFPKPRIVREQVRFWEKVFYKYPATTVVVHDANDPDKMIDIIDAGTFKGRFNAQRRAERDRVARKFVKRYEKAAARFKRYGKRALRYGAIEKRLYAVYKRSPHALAKLYKGQVSLRAQTGLADDFKIAAERARRWLPNMERIFRAYGLPVELTRIVFVESMFNPKAISKVGASGMWQFMPRTAKKFIYVTSLVDERNAPLKATKAAAQLLAQNFKELKSWPLAITAYNHGRAGMNRAARTIGTRDIGQIIKYYNSRSFGFASRNFYSEFLAANATYDRLVSTGVVSNKPIFANEESIILKRRVTTAQLLKHTPLDRKTLQKHNPCLLDKAFTKYRHKALPPYYEIRVPGNLARTVRTALGGVRGPRYARR